MPQPAGPMPSPPCPRCGQAVPATAPGGECPACLVALTLTQPHDPAPDEAPPTLPGLEVLGLVGRGGMGAVYKARHTALGRLVAVKLLGPARAADPAFAERFVREGRALARLAHPHIVAVHDIGDAAGVPYLVMEYVDGSSLRDLLRAGKLAPAVALRMVPQLCDAIQYAHDRGVVHRDIKPENVLIDAAGNAKIADFGLAKTSADGDFTLTGTGERMGTARYMAPEQWANTAGVDHRADIYSLGVMFYEMLTGDLPTPQCKPPSARAGTDPRLDRVVARSLCAEPAERYQQAGEIKTEVQRIAATSGRRKTWVLGILAALVVAAGVVAAAVAVGGRKPGGDPPADPGRGLSPTDILTAPDWDWTAPENLGPEVNSDHRDQSPCPAADGLSLVFASDRPGGQGDLDLWECRRAAADQPFGDPVNLGPGVNGPAVENDPCLSADGLTLLFVSTRGGPTKYDIFVARRPAVGAPWGAPEALGPEVNSEYAEFRPWLSADGLRLTFNSLRPPREGVYASRRATPADPFGPAAPYGKNHTRLALGGISFAADDGTVLCHRFNAVFPGNLLWLSRIENPDEPFRRLTTFGPVVNSDAIDAAPSAAADGRTVYFQSDRTGGQGEYDLWQTRRVPKGK